MVTPNHAEPKGPHSAVWNNFNPYWHKTMRKKPPIWKLLYKILALISLFSIFLSGCLINRSPQIATDTPQREETSAATFQITATSTTDNFKQSLETHTPTHTSIPTQTATPTPPAWAGYPGPTQTVDTQIPPPFTDISLPSEVKVSLLLGTDTFNPVIGRTDTIILLFYNSQLAKASFLSIPRDLYVYIPGYSMNRINQAYPLGGIDTLLLTLEYNFNIHVDNWMLIHINDFVAFVDDLGGVDVYDPQYNIDEYDGNPPEYHHMEGHEALWYVRKREGTSDIDRNRRQQEMIRALMREILWGGNLVHLPAWYAKYSESFRSNLNLVDLFNFIPLALNFGDQERLQFAQISWEDVTYWRTPSGASVLLPDRQAILWKLQNAMSFVLAPQPYKDLVHTLEAQLTASPIPTETQTNTPSLTPTNTPSATPTPSTTTEATIIDSTQTVSPLPDSFETTDTENPDQPTQTETLEP